jgi:hypothetical protein
MIEERTLLTAFCANQQEQVTTPARLVKVIFFNIEKDTDASLISRLQKMS